MFHRSKQSVRTREEAEEEKDMENRTAESKGVDRRVIVGRVGVGRGEDLDVGEGLEVPEVDATVAIA